VIHGYLPGGQWDGSSCFNFMKEFVSRSFGGTPTPFYQQDKLKIAPSSKAALDSASFATFLLKLPFVVFFNTWSTLFTVINAMSLFGGPGLSMEVALINYDEKDSAKISKAAAALGAKPYAAFTFAAVTAFKELLHENPHCIIQQASMQSRHFLPEMERNVTGDW
jgi:hypothetical protein